MVIQIPLTNSTKFATIDDSDAEKVKGFTWWEHFPRKDRDLSYAYGMKLPRKKTGEQVIKMHRLILGTTDPSKHIDHKDGNGLNNCQANLTYITRAQNLQKANFVAELNPRKRHSKYRGVSFLAWHGKFVAYVDCNGRRKYLGYFKTEEEAARARDAKAKELHGNYARLNFEDS